jgi:hypothetical protein
LQFFFFFTFNFSLFFLLVPADLLGSPFFHVFVFFFFFPTLFSLYTQRGLHAGWSGLVSYWEGGLVVVVSRERKNHLFFSPLYLYPHKCDGVFWGLFPFVLIPF